MQLSLENWNYVKIYRKGEAIQVYNYLRQYSGYQHILETKIPSNLEMKYVIEPSAGCKLQIIDGFGQDDDIFSFISRSYIKYIQELDMFYNYAKEFLVDNLKMPDFIDQRYKSPSVHYHLPTDREVLIAHDMMGGYTEDNSIKVRNPKKGFYYRMLHFMSSSIFNYFSHHFITIPPMSYIKIAHDLGSKILGTIIIEHADLYDSLIGELGAQEMPILDKLISILNDKGFDGYLLNFESR